MQKNLLTHLSDADLIAQLSIGVSSQVVCAEVYRRYADQIFRTCLGVVKNRDVAADLSQEVLLKVITGLSKLNNGFLLGFWLHRIAKNVSLNYCRQQARYGENESPDQLSVVDESSEEWEAHLLLENQLEKLAVGMAQLRAEDQELLKLKYFQNWSVEQLCARYQLSESAIKMRLARARGKIAIQVAKASPELAAA